MQIPHDVRLVPTDLLLINLAYLIDTSCDQNDEQGLKQALNWITELETRELKSAERALLHYFHSNVWADLKQIMQVEGSQTWNWQQEYISKQIFYLRSARYSPGFMNLDQGHRLSISTNLGNTFSTVGRFIEALYYYDEVISHHPTFGMAIGNKGIALLYYSRLVYDPGHRGLIIRNAYSNLIKAITSELHPQALSEFERAIKQIQDSFPTKQFLEDYKPEEYSLGHTKAEQDYRSWCLTKHLFLNPLNDLGAYSIAARDVLSAPSIVYAHKHETLYFHAFFDQLKQEYVAARYFYYEGIKLKTASFVDKELHLYNTLDYPSYGISLERVKSSYRTSYALFDKVAYLLNAYLELGIPEKQISFRSLWFINQKHKQGLRSEFTNRNNWPMRGLFWLSKDLVENQQDIKDAIDPDAFDLANIRNHLEHKMLRLHNEHIGINLPKPGQAKSYSLFVQDFENKALKLLKLARAALVYLSLSLNVEERERQSSREPNKIIVKQRIPKLDE